MLVNIKGQALIESLWSLPLFIGVISLMFISFTHFLSHYLTDHFVYESALCLAQENSLNCKNQLKRKMDLIPFSNYKILLFVVTQKKVSVRLELISIGNYSNQFNENFELPLVSKHFREAL